MAHVSACSLLALLASRVRRVTFSARSTWLSVVLSARSACLPLHAVRGLHSRVSRCSSAFADSASRAAVSLCLRDYASRPLLSLPSRLRVSAVALCLRGFRVSALSAFAGFASRPLCTPLVWLTLSAFAFLRLGLLHTSSVAHSFARPLRGFLCTLVCDSFVHVSCVAFLVDSMQPPPFGSGMFG